jgi:hypothetical protein
MRSLTIEDLLQNPNDVMAYPLPAHPSRLLLLIAQIAATCCREVAQQRLDDFAATEDGKDYWNPEQRKLSEEWHRTHNKIGEICGRLDKCFGVPAFDFCLSRDIEWRRKH